MLEFLRNLFVSDFMPHGHCYYWRPEILWLHAVADTLIALAYYSIPITLGYFVRRRRDLAFRWIFVLFGVFIFACGCTHAFEVWTLWHGTYRLSGVVKLLTAGVSLAAAGLLVSLVPRALALPSPAALAAANEQLARQTQELAWSNAELNAFSYSVSHDLRAPLRAMHGLSQALLEDAADRLDETGRDYAQRIMAAAARMDAMIQDLLTYSRISRAEFELEPVSLGDVVAEALRVMDADMQQRHAAVAVVEPLPAVRGHRGTLVQIVTNLLGNAIKFVSPQVTPQVRVWAEHEGARVLLHVEDNGIGIAPEYQERIFAIFERLHGQEAFPGTGIGLAIVRTGVARMGGRVGVRSVPGQGSTFWVELQPVEPDR